MLTINLEDVDKYLDDPYHNKPLFIIENINNQTISQAMIDNDSTTNILPIKTLEWIGIDVS